MYYAPQALFLLSVSVETYRQILLVHFCGLSFVRRNRPRRIILPLDSSLKRVNPVSCVGNVRHTPDTLKEK
jgi:hypothetical protein